MSFVFGFHNTISFRPASGYFLGGIILLFYGALFTAYYVNKIYPVWGYFGFRLAQDYENPLALSFACIVFGYAFLPRLMERASDFVLWLLFILAFVPIQITLGLANSLQHGIHHYQLSLLFSLLITIGLCGMTTRVRWTPPQDKYIMNAPPGRRLKSHFSSFLFFMCCIVIVVLIGKFYSIMSFAGIDDIYGQRAASLDMRSGLPFGYLILWATYLFAPFLLSVGIYYRKLHFFLLGVAMLLVVYMISASKIIFVIIAFMAVMHVINRFGLRRRPYLLIFVPMLPLAVAYALDFSYDGYSITISAYIMDQVVLRGLAIQAMIFNLYVEFFSFNEFTYFSHVTGVSDLIDYPYDEPVGRVISIYQFGHPDVNANSGIWATDGVAAAGAVGVVVVGVLLGIFLGFANRVTRGVDHAFVGLMMVPLAMLFVNVSLFTSIASGGGFLLVVLLRRVWVAASMTGTKGTP